MNIYRIIYCKAALLGLALFCSLNVHAAVSAIDRLGFQSPTGFKDVNQIKPGVSNGANAFLGLVKADGTQDPSVPVTVSVSNRAALTVQKLSAPVKIGNFLSNYFVSVPSKAKVGAFADVTVGMTYKGIVYPPRTRRFVVVAEISSPPPPPPIDPVTLKPGVPADPEDVKAARFLEQAAFGPTPESMAAVKKLGINAWLKKEFTKPETSIPDGITGAQTAGMFLGNMVAGKDQLRQRVMFALSQMIVVSRVKNYNGEEVIPWMRLLSRNAFGNYYTLLREVTLSPTMGKYLDLANSIKMSASNKGGANENYAREVLQLFTIGLTLLDQNGDNTLINGQPQPTYDQRTIQQLALALTGWTYPTQPGKPKGNRNYEYFVGQMEPLDQYHDKTAKVLFQGTPHATSIPAGLTVQQELDVALQAIFNHPNLPPFVATRLIRSLVTSNPSPAYIKHVADVFVNNGKGVRGDLKAVMTAILTDPEARQDTPDTIQGHLKDPILHIVGLTRALGVNLSNPDQFLYGLGLLGQNLLASPTVFNYFSPLNALPDGSGLYGPEYQIDTPAQALLRANMIWQLLSSGLSSTTWPFDIVAFTKVAADPNQLIDMINAKLFQGRMSPELRQILFDTALPYSNLTQRSRTLLYLAAISSEYAVHR